MNITAGLDNATLQKVTDGISFLSMKIGEASPVIWKTFIMQAYLVGICCCAVFILSILLISAGFVIGIKTKWNNEELTPLIACFLVAGFILIIISLMFGFFGGLFFAPFNPEFYAINKLVSIVK